ncbi:MAG: hypothetical protein QOI47_1298 [Actinomycetota bacterium]|nr:hypothetical protein [Actinomycetota bacterium]
MSDAGADGDHDALRERLVGAAAEVFSEKGYDGARVQDIASRAGVTTGAIYGRFTGKAELRRAANAARSTAELDELFASHVFDGPATHILPTLGAHLVTRRSTTQRALLLEAFVAARRDPEVKRLVREIVEERAARLATLVERVKTAGGISEELDTLAVIRFCHAIGLGFLLFEAIDLPQAEPGPWEEVIARLVTAMRP